MTESPRSNARRVWSDTPAETEPVVEEEDQADPAGPVTVRLSTSGRRGRTVTVVGGLPRGELSAIARDLRRSCGSGGSVKGGEIEIQGDHRATIAQRLTPRFQVRAG